MYSTAVGKSMMADMSRQEVEDIWSRSQVITYTPNTVSSLPELERQLEGLLMDFLSHVAASRGLYARVSAREAELLLRYHCGGVMFLLRDWKEQDTAELDAIAHRLYQMMIREENPL